MGRKKNTKELKIRMKNQWGDIYFKNVKCSMEFAYKGLLLFAFRRPDNKMLWGVSEKTTGAMIPLQKDCTTRKRAVHEACCYINNKPKGYFREKISTIIGEYGSVESNLNRRKE